MWQAELKQSRIVPLFVCLFVCLLCFLYLLGVNCVIFCAKKCLKPRKSFSCGAYFFCNFVLFFLLRKVRRKSVCVCVVSTLTSLYPPKNQIVEHVCLFFPHVPTTTTTTNNFNNLLQSQWQGDHSSRCTLHLLSHEVVWQLRSYLRFRH